jgi:hypothetical protein
MSFEVAIVAVGLAGEEAFELALGRLGAQLVERRLGLLDDGLVALRIAELDQLDRVLVVLFDALVAVDQMVEPGALTGDFLRFLGIVPEGRVLDLLVQFGEAPVRDIPVKDASAATRATS